MKSLQGYLNQAEVLKTVRDGGIAAVIVFLGYVISNAGAEFTNPTLAAAVTMIGGILVQGLRRLQQGQPAPVSLMTTK